MKKAEWINGNHQKLNTGLKAFDQQVGGLGIGNIIDNVQSSSFVRSWWDKGRDLCDNSGNLWGQNDRAPGVLFEFDMKFFYHIPEFVYDYMEELCKKKRESVILYDFHHYNGDRRICDGYVITDQNHHLIKQFFTGPTSKSYGVILECSRYICEEE